MRITNRVIKALGYVRYCEGLDPLKGTSIEHDNSTYPFNQIRILIRKGRLKLKTDDTEYDISSLPKFISAVYFAGINKGKRQKQEEILNALGLRIRHNSELPRII